MQMKSGARPTIENRNDYSFNRTFGSVAPISLPSEFSVDIGRSMPNQIEEGNPFSCTAYTVCDLALDQDNTPYSEAYTYMKTLFIQGLPPETNGSDMRPAMKTAKVYGLLPKLNVPINLLGKGEDYTANQANWPVEVDEISGLLEHRKGNYFNIYDDGGLDWFDAFRSAMWLNKSDKRGICIGTPWVWTSAPAGFLTEHFVYDGNPQSVTWHCWAIKGWTTIEGVPYLIGKPWLGRNYGANGWVYISREALNKVMKIRGSAAFTIKDAKPEDIKTIQMGIIETILYYLWRILGLKRLN